MELILRDFYMTDGPRLRPPDVDAESGGVWTCLGAYTRRWLGKDIVVQESKLWGKELH